MENSSGHSSVLLQEAINGLEIGPGEIFLDCTAGSGGHSAEVLARFGSKVKIIALDADLDAIARTKRRLEAGKSSDTTRDITFVQENFRNLDKVLDDLGIARVNKILFDLGLSSNQLEESGRGFSFQKDEPLTMTFKKNSIDSPNEDITAAIILNTWSQETLETILKGYGEERYARAIAEKIVEARRTKPFATTQDLVNVILSATPSRYHHGRIHPATRTFQALRIATNDELQALSEGLQKAFDRLATGGRIAVISFHSLEDRIVKRFFRKISDDSQGERITKKPITPSSEELDKNPRSRSAKLRILVKTVS